MVENEWNALQEQIMELKYFGHFNYEEMACMTAEERHWFIRWMVNQKRKEAEAMKPPSYNTPEIQGPPVV